MIQVEFLIEGYLLLPTMEKLQVSEELILETVWRPGSELSLPYEDTYYSIAYVGVKEMEEAADYLNLFILIYSLVSGVAVRTISGVGTPLDDISLLGAKNYSFSNFEKIHVLEGSRDTLSSESILETKKLFLLLATDRQRILESYLGLALTYYYFAVLSSRRRLDEAVISLFIAAEALLITENKLVSRMLSRRLSTLIAKNEVERTAICKKMYALYGLRSAIVHGGGKKTSQDDVITLFGYVKRAIEHGLSRKDLPKNDLVARLDNACSEP